MTSNVAQLDVKSSLLMIVRWSFGVLTFGGFHKWGYPNSWIVFVRENPTEMDDNWGYPYDLGNLQILPLKIWRQRQHSKSSNDDAKAWHHPSSPSSAAPRHGVTTTESLQCCGRKCAQTPLEVDFLDFVKFDEKSQTHTASSTA